MNHQVINLDLLTPFTSAFFSPDGSRLLTIHNDTNSLSLWNVQSGQLISDIKLSPLWESGKSAVYHHLASCAVNNAGTFILLSTKDGTVTLYSVKDGHFQTIKQGDQSLRDFPLVQFSPDETLILIGFPGKRVEVWDWAQWQIQQSFEYSGHYKSGKVVVNHLSITADNHYLFAGFADMAVAVWDLKTGDMLSDAWEQAQTILDVYFRKDNVLWATDGGQIWRVVDYNQANVYYESNERWEEAVFSPDGDQVLVRTNTGYIKKLDIKGKDEAIISTHKMPGHWSFGTRDRRKVGLGFLSNGNFFALTTPWTIEVVHEQQRTKIELDKGTHIQKLLISPNSRLLALKLWPFGLKVFSLETGDLLTSLDFEDIKALAFSPNSEQIVIGRKVGSIHFWDIEKRQFGYSFSVHKHRVLALAFSPDGKKLYSAGSKAVRVWDIIEPKPNRLQTLKAGKPLIDRLFVLSDNRLVVDTGIHVEVWSSDLSEQLSQMPINPMCERWFLTDDEQYILETRKLQIVRLWSLDTGQIVETYQANTLRPTPMISEELAIQADSVIRANTRRYVWHLYDHIFHHQGRIYDGWIPRDSHSDDGYIVIPTYQGASLVSIRDIPMLISDLPYKGKYHSSCVTDKDIRLINQAGEIHIFPRAHLDHRASEGI